MSDSDDLPDLVASSDDDSNVNDHSETSVGHAGTWLKRGDKFLEKQELWMRVFSLSPFLFACNNIISVAWNKALLNAKLLLNESRNYETTYLEWQEWECLDLIDHVVSEVQTYLRNRNHLTKCLACAGKLDECKSGVVIDVDLAIGEACKVTEISDLWRSILKHQVSSGREKAAKFAVLYVIRIYREHVIYMCEKASDFIEHTKKVVISVDACHASKIAEEHKKKGNECFKNDMFDNAIKYYSYAAKEDPFNHVYYGNRAQAYIVLKKYKDALADGRRAVVIKPDFPKGHYRYAVAFHELGQLDAAIRVNEKGLELCQKSTTQDYQTIQQLESQGQTFYQERTERNKNHVLTSIPKELAEKLASIPNIDTDITEKLGFKVTNTDRSRYADAPPLVSSDTDSDTAATDHKKVRRKKKSKSTTFTVQSSTKQESSKLKDIVTLHQTRNSNSSGINSKMQQQIWEKTEFMTHLSDGSDSHSKHANKSAMMSYQKALDIFHLHDNKEIFGMDESDVLTLKYAFSVAAIGTNNYKNILDGIEKLEEIKDFCETHDDMKFPVLYYGLGKAYVHLNRFPEAVEPLQNGYQVASSVTYTQMTWPGTKQLIKETEPYFLQECLKELLQLCKFPPTPDAVCRNHTDMSDKRTVIYLTDPDFKGFIQIICQMNCVITFHQICFRSYKSSMNKQSDKDVLDTVCATPDCMGYIIKVHIVRADSLSKEYISERYVDLKEVNRNKKPVAKQKTTSESKLAKKQEKKDKRKQRKKEYVGNDLGEEINDADSEVITDGASAMAFIEDMESVVQVLPDVKDTTVLRKDDLDVQKPGKSRKTKKRTKEKSRQILNFEVNFTDRKEETLLNENSVLSDEDEAINNKPEPIHNPFSVPTELKSQIKSFEKSYPGITKPALLSKPDEVTENLFSYFVDILKANGPLAIDDTRVQQEMDVFPAEAIDKIKIVGGLADFLRQSLKFAVIDDVISLMSDAKRAREMALLRRQERQDSGSEPAVQNVWKTVGKSVNNLDGLCESVKTSVSATLSTSSNLSVVNSSVISESSVDNSNSDSCIGDLTSFSSSYNNPQSHWSEGIGRIDKMTSAKPIEPSPTFDALNSIDDFPTSEISHDSLKRQTDDINGLDAISESCSELGEGLESGGYVEKILKPELRMTGLDVVKLESNISRSSSKSDISERSYRSDFSSDLIPKHIKPSNLGSAFGNIGRLTDPRLSPLPDDFRSQCDSAWSDYHKSSMEAFQRTEKNSIESINQEVQRVGEEFVRKSDEKFVFELAESVVERLYEGRSVTDSQRSSTLKRVSSDIWKDFERSANVAKKGGSSLWENTPAGADYSKNMGKFATDFMKRHYDNSESSSVSPTTNGNIVHPQKPSVPPDSFNSISNNSGFNAALPWPEDNITTKLPLQEQPSVSTNSGYTLFSGDPTWGFDSFDNNTGSPSVAPPLIVPPKKPMVPPGPVAPSGPFVRPPLSVSSYYQNPHLLQMSFRPPMPPIPPMPIPPPPIGMPLPPQFQVEKKDQATQMNKLFQSTGTMTEPYEPFKKEYVQMKESRDEAMRVMSDSKLLYEKVVHEHKAKEQQVLVLEADINNKVGMFNLEKKSWKSERDTFVEEIKRLQEQMQIKEQLEQEIKEKMMGQERRVNELAKLAKDQRDKDLTEIKKCLENAEKYRRVYEGQLARSISAETEILASKLQTALNVQERSQKEAVFHQQRVLNFIQKHEEDHKPVPPPLHQARDFWSNAMNISEENINKVKAEYEDQIERVKAGTQLAELDAVTIPIQPPVPESIRALPFMQPGMTNFMMPPRMQFQNRPPLTNSGMANIPSPVAGLSKSTEVSQPPASVNSVSGQASPNSLSLYNTNIPTSRPMTIPSTVTGPPPATRAPLTVPNRVPLRPIGIGSVTQMTSFEKLVLKLKMAFPDTSRVEISQLIQRLRVNRGGSLSGMTMEDIIQQITEVINANQGSNGPEQSTTQQTQVCTGMLAGPPPGLGSSWAFMTGGMKGGSGKVSGTELYREDEDPCVICHEEMDRKSVVTLECGHLFHDECIRKWFLEQSTCPNCRVHTLLSDDFPSL